MPIQPTNVFVPMLVSVLVVWRVYRRIRRNVGRQCFQPRRTVFRIVMFSFISMLIAVLAFQNSALMFAFAGGLPAGTALAFVGLKLTRFDTTAEGSFYTPNTYLGIALSLLLIARLAYRLTIFYSAQATADGPPKFAQSPLTLFIFGLLAGYYIFYFAGVFVRCRKLVPASRATFG